MFHYNVANLILNPDAVTLLEKDESNGLSFGTLRSVDISNLVNSRELPTKNANGSMKWWYIEGKDKIKIALNIQANFLNATPGTKIYFRQDGSYIAHC